MKLRLHSKEELLSAHWVLYYASITQPPLQRLTLWDQETFWLMCVATEELKGPAGLNERGVSL